MKNNFGMLGLDEWIWGQNDFDGIDYGKLVRMFYNMYLDCLGLE